MNELWTDSKTGRPVEVNGPSEMGRTVIEGRHIAPLATGTSTLTRFGEVTRVYPERLKEAHWKDLLFRRCNISELRLMDCVIENCIFENCDLRSIRSWRSLFRHCTFVKTQLQGAVLGAYEHSPNTYDHVSFVRCDLRRTIHGAAAFSDCVFNNSNLDRVEFKGNVFTRCVFIGKLRETVFLRRSSYAPQMPDNMMEKVDFSRARLRLVDLRKVSTQTVVFPRDEEHIIAEDLEGTLARALQLLNGREGIHAAQLQVLLETMQEWRAPDQRRGVFNKQDLLKYGGEEGLAIVLAAVR